MACLFVGGGAAADGPRPDGRRRRRRLASPNWNIRYVGVAANTSLNGPDDFRVSYDIWNGAAYVAELRGRGCGGNATSVGLAVAATATVAERSPSPRRPRRRDVLTLGYRLDGPALLAVWNETARAVEFCHVLQLVERSNNGTTTVMAEDAREFVVEADYLSVTAGKPAARDDDVDGDPSANLTATAAQPWNATAGSEPWEVDLSSTVGKTENTVDADPSANLTVAQITLDATAGDESGAGCAGRGWHMDAAREGGCSNDDDYPTEWTDDPDIEGHMFAPTPGECCARFYPGGNCTVHNISCPLHADRGEEGEEGTQGATTIAAEYYAPSAENVTTEAYFVSMDPSANSTAAPAAGCAGDMWHMSVEHENTCSNDDGYPVEWTADAEMRSHMFAGSGDECCERFFPGVNCTKQDSGCGVDAEGAEEGEGEEEEEEMQAATATELQIDSEGGGLSVGNESRAEAEGPEIAQAPIVAAKYAPSTSVNSPTAQVATTTEFQVESEIDQINVSADLTLAGNEPDADSEGPETAQSQIDAENPTSSTAELQFAPENSSGSTEVANWDIRYLGITADMSSGSTEQLVVNYEIGKDRMYVAKLMAKDCVGNVTGIDVNSTSPARMPQDNGVHDSLVLGYSLEASALVGSNLWNAATEAIEFCHVLQLVAPGDETNPILVFNEDERRFVVGVDLSIDFSISQDVVPGDGSSTDASASVESFVEACRCDSAGSFACVDGAPLPPGEELVVCIWSKSSDMQVDFLDSMVSYLEGGPIPLHP